MKQNSLDDNFLIRSFYLGKLNRTGWWVGWGILKIITIIFSFTPFDPTKMTLDDIGFWLLFLFFLAAQASIDIRRIHDFGRSGWWFLIMLIPGLEFVRVVLLGFLPSNKKLI